MAKSGDKKKNKKDKKKQKKDEGTKGKRKADKKGKSKSKETKNEKKPLDAEQAVNLKKGAILAELKCIPCRGGVPPLGAKEIGVLLPQLRGWKAIDNHHLEREVKFKDFATALDFTIEVGELAEVEQHHPDIYLAWGKVGIKIWTHKIDGLTESDFILAAKIDQLT